MALDKTEVQKVYVAYFNRPADPGGLAYWMSSDWGTVFDFFPTSTESQNLYSGATVADQITSIYNKLLGRAPDAEGLAYWVGEINNPLSPVTAASAAKAIIDAALGSATDAANVLAKLNAAAAFTDELASKDVTTQNKYNQVSMQQEARDFLTGVDASTTDTTQKIAVLMTDIENAPAIENTGETYSYSEIPSTKLVGTAGDDMFYISGNSVHKVYIAGGDGYDTLITDDSRDFVTDGVEKIIMKGGSTSWGDFLKVAPGDFEDYEKSIPQNNTVEYDASPTRGLSFGSSNHSRSSSVNYKITGTKYSDNIFVGDGNDTIDAGEGRDYIYAGEGADVITGGQGQDYHYYKYNYDSTDPVAFSSLYSMDHITDFEIGTDVIRGEYSVSKDKMIHIATPVDALTDVAINNVLNDTNFPAKKAATFTYAGRTFLVLNDDINGFQAETDAIIEITGYIGDLSLLFVS